jgi:hypothetical protein
MDSQLKFSMIAGLYGTVVKKLTHIVAIII